MDTVYTIVPAGPKPMLFFIPIFVILAAVALLLFVSVRGADHSRFTLASDGIRLSGDVYGRTIAYPQLQLDRARIVDLRGEPSLQPVRRTLGTGLPGYSAGWFRLRNGEKSLLYLTDRTRALYIPTKQGYSLLLSPQHPDRMLEDLRNRR